MASEGRIPFMAGPALAGALFTSIAAAAVMNPQTIQGNDTTTGDMFGYAAAISGNTAIVGARLDDTPDGANAGSAYVFDTTTNTQSWKLTADDAEPGDFFGRSVAIDGTVALIGAAKNDDNGNDSGSAYLFNTTTGSQLHKLTAADAAPSDQFGHTVAISGTWAIIAAPWEDQAGANAGAVYVFNTTTGTQQRKLTAPNAKPGDLFGSTLAADANLVLIGAMTDAHGTDSGSAYLFNTQTGAYLREFTASDAAAGDAFGQVALDANLALIGAPGNDEKANNAGAAYLFDINTGNELFKFTASDATPDSKFGHAVALSGNLAMIGAYNTDSGTGAVYGFDTFSGNELFKFTLTDAQPGESFGFALGLDGLTAVIGSPLFDTPADNAGRATLLQLPPPPPPIVGDLNHDGYVGIEDLNYLLFFWNEYAGFRQDQEGDITGDGYVGIDDLTFMLTNWNQGTPPGKATLPFPSPASGMLVSPALALLSLRPSTR